MKKIKLYTILMVSVLLTACGTDKKIEKQANNIVDAVENNDISELDFIINGTDELAEDEELADFFETDTEQGNGLMSKIIKHDTIEVKKVGKDAITYKITAPDLSNLFSDMKAGNVTEENIDSFMDDYISDAKMVTNEVDVSYTYENEKFSAEYDTEEFINALTGNMVTAYQELIQDVQNEISEEDNNEESNYFFSLCNYADVICTYGIGYRNNRYIL